MTMMKNWFWILRTIKKRVEAIDNEWMDGSDSKVLWSARFINWIAYRLIKIEERKLLSRGTDIIHWYPIILTRPRASICFLWLEIRWNFETFWIKLNLFSLLRLRHVNRGVCLLMCHATLRSWSKVFHNAQVGLSWLGALLFVQDHELASSRERVVIAQKFLRKQVLVESCQKCEMLLKCYPPDEKVFSCAKNVK